MTANEKIDLFKQLKDDFKPAKRPVLFETTPGFYLAINGTGKPGSRSFKEEVEALYSMAFTIKMTRKAGRLGDYVVCKLEALWWVDSEEDISQVDQEYWQYKLMIRTPACVDNTDLQKACKALLDKGKAQAVEKVLLEQIDEGKSVQMLHVGPYDKEGETIAQIQAFMAANNLDANGPHHEIYISDPRRIEPEKLKTILRQPVIAR